jgi:2-acylglycerol O-acyltransferase 2/2-acylglycerol O-acyltransferase 1
VLGIFLFLCSFPPLWPLILVYLVYFVFFDYRSHENGDSIKKASPFFRNSLLWKYFSDYFPLTLYKTHELAPTFVSVNEASAASQPIAKSPRLETTIVDDDSIDPIDSTDSTISEKGAIDDENSADKKYQIIQSSNEFQDLQGHFGVRAFMKELVAWLLSFLSFGFGTKTKEGLLAPDLKRVGRQYIFGYHPHGIISMGAIGAIATEGRNWSKLFPGIPVSTLTLVAQFQLPFYREYLLSLGLASVSKRSCTSLLKRGQSICIVLGGAQESLLALPGQLNLVLNKRKGFVKLAMTVPNTTLVPTLAFGENDIYDQVRNDEHSTLFKLQDFLKRKLGFTLPLMHARGIFNYDFGIIPYRRPINIVVGEPIDMPYRSNPSDAEIDYYHRLYVSKLKKIYDDFKDKFHKDLTGNFDDCVYTDLEVVA